MAGAISRTRVMLRRLFLRVAYFLGVLDLAKYAREGRLWKLSVELGKPLAVMSGGADAYTATSSLGVDQTAWEQLAYFALRPELYMDSIADVKPTNETHRGSAVTFTSFADLNAATTALSETVDVDAVALSDSPITVTLVEYGNAAITTAKLRATSFIPLDPVVANIIGFNAGISEDTLARNVLEAGSNVRYAGGVAGRTSIGVSNNLTGALARRAQKELRSANVPTFNGYYAGIIHPDIAYDFQGETGATGWRDPHVYSQPENIWNGEIGAFEGTRWMESPRAPLFVNASNGSGAAGNIDVYGTLVVGRQALAKAHSKAEGLGPHPVLRFGAVVDKLQRFVPVGWYHLVGYARFREAALRRIESASSIGVNTS